MLLTADPARACRWIALVTSLLPTHQALEVSFRVHVNDLSGALERILVLHPWSRAFQGDVLDRAGYAGFDVDAGASNQPTKMPSRNMINSHQYRRRDSRNCGAAVFIVGRQSCGPAAPHLVSCMRRTDR